MKEYTNKPADVSRTLDSSLRTSKQAMQRKFVYEEGDADKNTALKRVLTDEYPLAKEIEGAAEICKVKYLLPAPFTAEKGRDEGCHAEIQIPGEDADSGEAVQKSHDISTLHELTHVKAIFENEFDLAPKVYHTVYEGETFHGRVLIPLEEALTVGFVNEGTKKHLLHTIDTFKPLSALSDEEWKQFAPLQKERYSRVYGAVPNPDEATENKFRAAEKRLFYVPGRKNQDEAWQGMEVNENAGIENKGHHDELEKMKNDLEGMKKTFDESTELKYEELSDAFKDADDDNFFLGAAKKLFEKYDKDSFATLKGSFLGDYDEICIYFSDIASGGNIEQWSGFKIAYSIFKQKYGDLIPILSSYKNSKLPVDFSLF